MITPEKKFQLTEKQREAQKLASGDGTYVLFAGGSRSGKSAVICHLIILRAILIPGSRAGVFRSTAVSCRATLFDLTFRQMMRLAQPGLLERCKWNETEMTCEFPNGSIVMFGGLEDHNLERVLGQEYCTLFVNEATEFHNFRAISLLMTRLSQQCVATNGKKARLKFFFDCNPSSSKHWTYKCWREKVHPDSGTPWPKPELWQWLQMNPHDNAHNLAEGYIDNLSQGLSARERKRFIEGDWQTEVDGALFKIDWIDKARVDPRRFDKNEMLRIIVAVDPATSANPGSDETGIVVCALDAQGQTYLLEDASMRGTPDQWARKVADVFERHEADLVVYESNQGGLMVETTLRSAFPNLPLKAVHASRGKVIRAEPVSALYEKGRVSHVGEFKELESQMESFTLDFNRAKQGSPDRLDALVWALTELALEKQHRPSTVHQTTAGGFFG